MGGVSGLWFWAFYQSFLYCFHTLAQSTSPQNANSRSVAIRTPMAWSNLTVATSRNSFVSFRFVVAFRLLDSICTHPRRGYFPFWYRSNSKCVSHSKFAHNKLYSYQNVCRSSRYVQCVIWKRLWIVVIIEKFYLICLKSKP
jgi:hypothetical protein